MPAPIDWSRAGKRLRFTPRGADGRNPDWNFRDQRWKDETDYVGETLTDAEVVNEVSCLRCRAMRREACRDSRERTLTDMVHHERRRHAAERRIANAQG